MAITTTTPVFTPTFTPTICPIPTPVALLVDPVTSPTDHFTQTILIYMTSAEAFPVTLETGTFTTTGPSYPALVDVDLNPNATHQLTVKGHVPVSGDPNGCQYGGYTLPTGLDRNGDPLTIV